MNKVIDIQAHYYYFSNYESIKTILVIVKKRNVCKNFFFRNRTDFRSNFRFERPWKSSFSTYNYLLHDKRYRKMQQKLRKKYLREVGFFDSDISMEQDGGIFSVIYNKMLFKKIYEHCSLICFYLEVDPNFLVVWLKRNSKLLENKVHTFFWKRV